MPPGVSSSAVTDIFGGNTALGLSITIILYLVAPFSVPILFYFTISSSIQLDLISLAKLLTIMIVLPLIISQFLKYFFSQLIDQSIRYISAVNILLIASVGYIAFSPRSHVITSDFQSFLYNEIWLFLMFFITFLVGILIMWRANKADKIAIAVSKTYMNNVLAIVIASQYFDSRVVLITVLSAIPWSFTPGIMKQITVKFLK